MSKQTTLYSKKIFQILLSASIIVVFTHICLKYLSVVVFNEQNGFFFELSSRLDLNDENSVPQWLTHLLFLTMAVSSFLAFYMEKNKERRKIWIIIAILGLILAIDDVATLHEFVLQSIHNALFIDTAPSFFTNAWLVLLPFILLGLLWLYIRIVKLFPKITTIIMTSGGIVFVFGAVIVDSIINNVNQRSFLGQGLLGALEGGIQLLGMCIFLFGIHSYIETKYSSRIKEAVSALKG